MNRKARRAARKEATRPQPAGSLQPGTANALLRQGEQHFALGHVEQARAAFEQALALDPDRAATHFYLGNLLRREGNDTEAVDYYLNAILLAPEMMEAHQNLCAILLRQERYDAVIAHFSQVMTLRPDYAGGYNVLTSAFLGIGDGPRAFDAVLKSLRIAETVENKTLFSSCLQSLAVLPDSAETRARLVKAISEPWGRPANFAPHAVALLKADPAIGPAIDRAMQAWPVPLPAAELFAPDLLGVLVREPLLHCLLENARIADIAMEHFLTACRRALLETAAVADGAAAKDLLAFGCALARQCFITEYAYLESDQEKAAIDGLRERMAAALDAGDRVPPLWLPALAAYAPLDALGKDDILLARQWPQPIEDLLRQQVGEPAAERKLRAAMPRLTPVADDVSMMVRDQYEQNPYPRWVKAAPANVMTTVDTRLRNQFPLANYRPLRNAEAVDILVAGCGTGQQVIDPAQSFTGARVLAIDLSLASLGYAKRQTDALGIRNVEYGQADILELGRLGRDFDVVECTGVLHHLGDPLAGWRVLLSLVRPHGLMRIALYSEMARQHVVAARALIAARGYDGSVQSIRRFRREVLALPDTDPVRLITRMSDFFSISDCRDFVFHVQEHRFTLPQIKAFLAENDLEFLGFEAYNHTLARYGAQFPEDIARTDLDRWHAFEQAHIWTFVNMYQFWVQRRS